MVAWTLFPSCKVAIVRFHVIPRAQCHESPRLTTQPRALHVNTFPLLTAAFVALRDLTPLAAVGSCTYTDFYLITLSCTLGFFSHSGRPLDVHRRGVSFYGDLRRFCTCSLMGISFKLLGHRGPNLEPTSFWSYLRRRHRDLLGAFEDRVSFALCHET